MQNIAQILKTASEEFLQISLDDKTIDSLLSISKFKTYKKGDVIIDINSPLIYTGLILNGVIRSYYINMEGEEITKRFHSEYFLFMDEGLFGYKKSICIYEALEDTETILFDTEKLKMLIKTNETLKDLYITSLENGIRYKIYRENEFLMKNATERYLQFKKDYPQLEDKVKQSYISSYLGIKPESLSRIRKTLKSIK